MKERMSKLNKKGQDLSIGTLILIVLGIIVLVLLILGFSYGWTNLWDKINIFGGGASIADVVTKCSLAATSNAVTTYCDEFEKVKVNNVVEYVNCEDGRVDAGLETKITCTGKTKAQREAEFCKTLSNSDIAKGIKANGELCSVAIASSSG